MYYIVSFLTKKRLNLFQISSMIEEYLYIICTRKNQVHITVLKLTH